MEASKKGHLEVVQVLLAAGADKEAKSDVSGEAGVGGVPCVHVESHLAVVQALLAAGADMEAKS